MDEALFQSSPQPQWVYDVETLAFRDVNPAAIARYGYSRAEFLAMTIQEIRPPEDCPAVASEASRPGVHDRTGPWRHLLKDGSHIHVEVISQPLVFEGRDARLITVLDVTERGRVQRLAEEQRAFYEQLLGSIDLDIASFDPQGRFEYTNPQSVRDPEVRDWMVGRTNLEYACTRKGDVDLGRARHESILEAARTGEPTELEEVVHTSDGEPRYFLRHHTPVLDESGQVIRVVGHGVDRTEWHRAQEALRRSEDRLHEAQKMEAVGRLAGGVAHDFNNLLTVIMGHTELLLLGGTSPEAVEDEAEGIRDAAQRARTLVRQLLALGRRESARLESVSLDRVLREQEPVFRRLLGERIRLKLDLNGTRESARVDRSQLEQVLLNLVLNARDAMPRGGELRLAVREVPAQGGDRVVLEASDTGQGMLPEVRDRIFEPFFSTKPREEGTGLGLSVVYGFVKLWDGAIEVDSSPDEGTTIRISLPASGGG